MICLDSSFVIDFLNKDRGAKRFLEGTEEELFLSEMTIFEVMTGILYHEYKHGKSDFDNFLIFLDNVEIMSTMNFHSFEAARINASLMFHGKRINNNDCIIAGTMIANGISKIITKNSKDFSKIEGIEVIGY